MAIGYKKDEECEIIEEGVCSAKEKTVNYKPVTKNIKFLSFLEILSLILVIAKITGYTTISWFWVFVPVILHAIIIIVLIIIVLAVFFLALIVAALAS